LRKKSRRRRKKRRRKSMARKKKGKGLWERSDVDQIGNGETLTVC